MSTVDLTPPESPLWEETRKLAAFFRRDLLTALTYPMSFFSNWLGIGVQIFLYYFMGKLIAPDVMPSYEGVQPSYIEFVTVGIVVTSIMQVALTRVVAAMRQEQFQGTLESLMVTPTHTTTVQLGAVVYDLLYVPLRTGLLLVGLTLLLDVSFYWPGLLPTAMVLLVFMPFVWGLGVATAAGIVTFRSGGGFIGFVITLLTISSGTFFPLDVFPDWLRSIAEVNPIAIALQASREALIGRGGWDAVGYEIAILIPISLVSLAIGTIAFRAAISRERRRGTLGLY